MSPTVRIREGMCLAVRFDRMVILIFFSTSAYTEKIPPSTWIFQVDRSGRVRGTETDGHNSNAASYVYTQLGEGSYRRPTVCTKNKKKAGLELNLPLTSSRPPRLLGRCTPSSRVAEANLTNSTTCTSPSTRRPTATESSTSGTFSTCMNTGPERFSHALVLELRTMKKVRIDCFVLVLV